MRLFEGSPCTQCVNRDHCICRGGSKPCKAYIGPPPRSDFQRGLIDGFRFDAARETVDGWQAVLKTGGLAWIVEAVTASYLDGLQAVGCIVLPLSVTPRAAA